MAHCQIDLSVGVNFYFKQHRQIGAAFFVSLWGAPVPQFPHSPSVSQLLPVSYDHSALIPNRPAKTGLLLRDDAQKPAQSPENGHRHAEIASFLRDDAAVTICDLTPQTHSRSRPAIATASPPPCIEGCHQKTIKKEKNIKKRKNRHRSI